MKAVWQVIADDQDGSLVRLYNIYFESYLCRKPATSTLCMSGDKRSPHTLFRVRFYSRREGKSWNLGEDSITLETLEGEKLVFDEGEDSSLINNQLFYRSKLCKKYDDHSSLLNLKVPNSQNIIMGLILRDFGLFLEKFSSQDVQNKHKLQELEQCLEEVHAYLFREIKGRVDYDRIYD